MSRLAFTCSVLVACGSSPSSTSEPDARPADLANDASACGVRTSQRGKTSRTLRVAGLDRTYLVYLPDGDPLTPMPLVYVHHGYSMSGQAMFEITGYPALADREHIALAFPDGQGGPDRLLAPWNAGSSLCPSAGGSPPSATGDDFAFLDAMKADIALDQCIDDTHVYVTGFSMGGYFSHHVGCMRDDIRAIAPHSGGTHSFDTCTTGHKPVMIFHGTADLVVSNGCDDPAVPPPLPSVTASATAWAAKNGCATTATARPVTGGTCSYYDGCPADGQVAICTFTAMGHCWAGGVGPSIFACGSYADATELEWAFFKQYAW